MMRKRRLSPWLVVAVALLAAACDGRVETWSASPKPAEAPPVAAAPAAALPLEGGVYVARGVCFGEGGCPFVHWRADAPVGLRGRIDPAAPVVATVKPGEWVEPMEGQFRLIPIRGEVRVATDTPQGRLEIGDVVYMLEPQWEGWYSFWFRGQRVAFLWAEGDASEPIVWDPPPATPPGAVTGWWVRVRLENGASGWVESPRFACMGPLAGDEGCRG